MPCTATEGGLSRMATICTEAQARHMQTWGIHDTNIQDGTSVEPSIRAGMQDGYWATSCSSRGKYCFACNAPSLVLHKHGQAPHGPEDACDSRAGELIEGSHARVDSELPAQAVITKCKQIQKGLSGSVRVGQNDIERRHFKERPICRHRKGALGLAQRGHTEKLKDASFILGGDGSHHHLIVSVFDAET